MARTYEIEIKGLLGERENAEVFKKRLTDIFPEIVFDGTESHLNHYFNRPETLDVFKDSFFKHTTDLYRQPFLDIVEEGKGHSIRTRNVNGNTLLVIKASVGDDTSENGVSRIEFEMPFDGTIEELDALLLDAGLTYQAKWSRVRELYRLGKTTITVDQNAGYGYVTEFERVVNDETPLGVVRKEIEELMDTLGVAELPQDRLERMFAHYNENWNQYYGTDKVFTII